MAYIAAPAIDWGGANPQSQGLIFDNDALAESHATGFPVMTTPLVSAANTLAPEASGSSGYGF